MWYYQNSPYNPQPEELDPKVDVGFVYIIHNLVNGKKYIGKKLFFSTRSKKVAGQKRKKKVKLESDWRSYYGSNATIQQDLKDLGPDNFRREILYFCGSKSECNYLEAYEQFTRKAILDKNYYNDWLTVKVTRKHLGALQF